MTNTNVSCSNCKSPGICSAGGCVAMIPGTGVPWIDIPLGPPMQVDYARDQTLRQHYAGIAMRAFLSNPEVVSKSSPEEIPRMPYAQADSMVTGPKLTRAKA